MDKENKLHLLWQTLGRMSLVITVLDIQDGIPHCDVAHYLGHLPAIVDGASWVET